MALSKFTLTVASGAVSSNVQDVGLQGWDFLTLEIKSMISNATINLLVSTDNSNFRRLYHPVPNTATAQNPVQWAVLSALTNGFVPVPYTGYRYVKVELAATADSGQVFELIGSNN